MLVFDMCLKYLHLDEWGRVFAPPAGFLKTYYTFILPNRCVSELRDLRTEKDGFILVFSTLGFKPVNTGWSTIKLEWTGFHSVVEIHPLNVKNDKEVKHAL